ncbi:MAG: Clp1/GlmU family protein [Thermodesulfobacteriota bacterium]
MENALKEFARDGLDMEGLFSARSVMVIGGPDTGKSTLARLISVELAARCPTALVDLDMGQSSIGPPTTVAWGRAAGPGPPPPEGFYFTGALSPPGSLLPSLAGACAVLDSALGVCGKAVIDTTGLVAGPVGLVLKQYKIELLAPDVIIALQRGSELEHILSSFSRLDRPSILRLNVPEGVRRRGAEERAEHRQQRFEEYFRGSMVVEVRLDDVDVRYTWGAVDLTAALGRAVSFRRGVREDVALGIIEGALPGREGHGSLYIRTPLKKGAPYTSIVVGVCSINLQINGS